jgi:hypothetical protein
MSSASNSSQIDPAVDANLGYDPVLFDLAKSEAINAVVKVWMLSRRRNRTAQLLATITLNLMAQMKKQRPAWFASLGEDGEKRLASEIIRDVKPHLYDWVESK